jgi:hypothetical protein
MAALVVPTHIFGRREVFNLSLPPAVVNPESPLSGDLPSLVAARDTRVEATTRLEPHFVVLAMKTE